MICVLVCPWCNALMVHRYTCACRPVRVRVRVSHRAFRPVRVRVSHLTPHSFFLYYLLCLCVYRYENLRVGKNGTFNYGFWGQECGPEYDTTEEKIHKYMQDAISVNTGNAERIEIWALCCCCYTTEKIPVDASTGNRRRTSCYWKSIDDILETFISFE